LFIYILISASPILSCFKPFQSNIKYRKEGREDQQKAGKQGRGDSIKQFSIQPHPAVERYVG